MPQIIVSGQGMCRVFKKRGSAPGDGGVIMVEQAHFLLTYTCNLECDHCFVYSSPRAEGTFALRQIRKVLGELAKLGTIEWVYFEGGESFLYYPLMLEGIRLARERGFKTGIVSNGYWATSVEDAELWLRPIAELGLADLSVSDDAFHFGNGASPAQNALEAARGLGMPTSSICIQQPGTGVNPDEEHTKGEPVTGGSVLFRGRAVEKLVEGLPVSPWEGFTECPDCELVDPKVVHLDAYGNVHLCQGLSMGNMWETPLSALIQEYEASLHPICGPLVRGGPAALVREHEVALDGGYVDANHLCYVTRLALLDRFPEYLAPRQCYGLG